jgi:hypothetical protein
MDDFSYPSADESTALGAALNYFLSDRIEEGKAELLKVRTASLERVYTAGLRLGIEAHALASQRKAQIPTATT